MSSRNVDKGREGGPRRPLADRLAARLVRMPNGCLEWTGFRQPNGYGQIGTGEGKRSRVVHRVAWELVNGPVPDGMELLHACDNRACCDLNHLSVGTRADNMRDMVSKGRERPKRGTSHPHARLSDDDVRLIRLRRDLGETCKSIAADFGVTPAYVGQLARGVWRKSA